MLFEFFSSSSSATCRNSDYIAKQSSNKGVSIEFITLIAIRFLPELSLGKLSNFSYTRTRTRNLQWGIRISLVENATYRSVSSRRNSCNLFRNQRTARGNLSPRSVFCLLCTSGRWIRVIDCHCIYERTRNSQTLRRERTRMVSTLSPE